MIPLRDIVKSRTVPFIMYIVIALCALVFFYQLSLSEHDHTVFLFEYGLVPWALDKSQIWEARGMLAQLLPFLSSMFMHGGWLHILGNMWTLFIFGDNVEDRMGHSRFAVFYLLSGFASMGLHVLTNWGSQSPAIGASGAIAGVMGAYLVFFPRARILTLLPIFIYFTVIEVPAFVFLLLWFALQFFSGTFSLMGDGAGAGIAWWAHVGGFAFGFLAAKLFERRNTTLPSADVAPLVRRMWR